MKIIFLVACLSLVVHVQPYAEPPRLSRPTRNWKWQPQFYEQYDRIENIPNSCRQVGGILLDYGVGDAKSIKYVNKNELSNRQCLRKTYHYFYDDQHLINDEKAEMLIKELKKIH